MMGLLEYYRLLFSLFGGSVLALGGGLFVWLTFHYSRRRHPLLCAAVMGFYCGVVGAGDFVLLGYLMDILTPRSGIRSALP